jgi:hypothetical protein
MIQNVYSLCYVSLADHTAFHDVILMVHPNKFGVYAKFYGIEL